MNIWSTDYRGPVCIFAGARIVEAGKAAARAAGLDADWHTRQGGWLGAAVLVDVHRAGRRCCHPWACRRRDDNHRLYHWVFTSPIRLALCTVGRGFLGLRPVSWSVLMRRSALGLTPTRSGTAHAIPPTGQPTPGAAQ